jgi:hypothetical protein
VHVRHHLDGRDETRTPGEELAVFTAIIEPLSRVAPDRHLLAHRALVKNLGEID